MIVRSHRAALSLLIALLPVVSAVGLSWDELLDQRVSESVAYRQSVLARRQSEQRLAQYDRFHLPYVSIGTGTAGIRYVGGEDGGLQTFGLQPSVSLTNVFGATVGVGLPLTVRPDPPDGQDGFTVGDPTLTVSRRIFEEPAATVLGVRAALLRAQDAEAAAVADIRIVLVSEIFDARSSARTLEDARTRLSNARSVQAASRDATAARDLERSVLQLERSVIQAERALRALDSRVVDHAESLYAEVDRRFSEWLAALPADTVIPETTRGVQAQELTLAAAEARSRLSFLPYLPNPTLSASLTWDRDDGSVDWSLGLQVSVPLLDRGERALASFERRESARIERLRLEQARDSLGRTLTNAWEDLDLLSIDLRIAELDLEVQEESAARTRDLYDRGFATEPALVSAELGLSAARLQVERLSDSYRLAQLRIARYFE
ncbi:MAG: hypothetical protein EA382_04765 [Spirochaetaceae bacterium]|nr:MAG: hypothetical protein EA382_04765 [Spirochaetaceae bacterium]